MKSTMVNTQYIFGSIWDELPDDSKLKREKKIPETQEEALELYDAAKLSLDRTTMTAWDKHNDMVAKSQKLRQIALRKEIIERQNIEHREEQTRLIEEAAEKARESEAALKRDNDRRII